MKNFPAIALLASILALPCSAARAGSEAAVCGDVNDSGTVNTTDALQVLRKGVGQPVTLDCSGYEDAIGACQESLTDAQDDVQTCQTDLAACINGMKCGDGVLNAAGEHCDQDDVGGADCQSLGFSAGSLACDDKCKFDTSGCDRCPEGSTFSDGLCWRLGASALEQDLVGSCDAACEAIGLECNEAALQLIGSGGSDEACRAAADLADPAGAPHVVSSVPVQMITCGEPTDYAYGCALGIGLQPPEINGTTRFLHEQSATLCQADYSGGFCATPTLRVCACNP